MSEYPFSEWMENLQQSARLKGERLPNMLKVSRQCGLSYNFVLAIRFMTAKRMGKLSIATALALKKAGFDPIAHYAAWVAEHGDVSLSPVRQ